MKHSKPGTVDERDKGDIVKYLLIVEKYNNKRLGSQQKTKAAAAANRSKYKVKLKYTH